MTTAKNSTKSAAKRSTKPAAKKTSHCWPGFTPVPGKEPGEKGSCKPKAKQSSAEKKDDARAAAASKREKS
jgi:hypothetical protein